MTTDADPLIEFSRDGEQLAKYKLSLVQEAFRLGNLLPSDYYWKPGMSEWKEVSELILQLNTHTAASAASALPADKLFIATTTFTLDGYKIIRYLGIVRGLVVRSPYLGEAAGGMIEGFFGGKNDSYGGMCEKTRSEAYEVMIKNAKAAGANAVVGVSYDTTEILQNFTEVLCYGTAAVIEPVSR
jgi:uncharacterized protein YbjQ (UPF0145 family)